MKISIRNRFFLSISLLILFFVALSWFLNSQLLAKYYLSQKKESLLESKRMIDDIYKGDPEAMYFALEHLEQNQGLSIYFLGADYQQRYNSSLRIFDGRMMRRQMQVPLLVQPIQHELNYLAKGDYIFDVITDLRLNTQFLVLASRLDNGELLLLSTPVAAIDESTAIANRFFFFTGLLTIFIGGIGAFLFANRFAKPILELKDIAQRMAKLDFSKKYSIQSGDEIEDLGDSINSLSIQLDQAISELKEANLKLLEDIEQERKIDKMRKEFISNVSHELKTPIALIQGYAEGLKLNINDDEESKEFYCDVIMDEADKMNRLVKDLLELSKIESGSFELEKTTFDINALINYVVDKYKPIISEKEVKVKFSQVGEAFIKADARRIEQILVNYLNNALNHIEGEKLIKIDAIDSGEKLKVSVFNTGKNIPEEYLDKLWTSFYKVDQARTREYGGTGLGLSVVKAIQELHGNAYGVVNKEDGVSFWFEVDLA